MDFLDDFFETLQANLSEEYISSARITSIIFGVIACALFIFTALATKRGVGFGIFAGIFYGFSFYVGHASVVLFHRIDFILNKTIYGTQDQLAQLAAQARAEYWERTLPDLFGLMICEFLLIAAWVVALIYMIHLLKIKPRVLTVFAMIIHIVRYVCVFPIKIISPILKDGATIDMQINQDTIFHITSLMPIILFSICAVIHLFSKKKKASVTENSDIE